MKATIVSFFAALLTLTGCEPTLQPAGMIPLTTTSKSVLANKNARHQDYPVNPFDSFGIWHNIILDSLHVYRKNTSDTTREGIRTYIKGFAKRHWNINIPASSKLLMPLWNKGNRDYKKLLQNERLTDNALMLEQELFQAIDSIKSLQEYDRFKRKITTIERKILKNPDLSIRNRNLLLIMSSVARHSAFYWKDKFSKMPDEIFLRKKKGLFKKVLKYLSTVGADATTAGFRYLEGLPANEIISDAANMSYVGYGCMTYYWEW